MYFLKRNVVVVILVVIFSIVTPKTANAQELNASRIEFITKYANIAMRLGAKYDLPWETAMGIAIYESQGGTSYSAIKRHNFHGISAGRAGTNKNFASDEEGWDAFYVNLLEKSCYAKALQFRDDPNMFFEAIVKGGYNPNHKEYIAKVGPFIEAVIRYREEQNLPTSQEYRMLYNALNNQPVTIDYALYTVIDPETTVCISENAVTSCETTTTI